MADFPRIVFLPGHTERDIRAIDVVEADGRARLDRATLETIIVRYLREHGYFVGQLRRQFAELRGQCLDGLLGLLVAQGVAAAQVGLHVVRDLLLELL